MGEAEAWDHGQLQRIIQILAFALNGRSVGANYISKNN